MNASKYMLLIATLCPLRLAHAVTIVYNMRVAEITKRQQLDPSKRKPNIIGETTFGQWRKIKNGARQSAYGAIATYIFSQKSFYLKIDGAVGHVRNDLDTITIKRTQTDDILFSGGYGHAVGQYSRFTYSALLGVPTHRDFILDLAQFGTGHVGIGGQFDAAYAYVPDRSRVLLAATRLIHFFPRNVSSHDPCIKPLYNCFQYYLKTGNIADLYVAHQMNWNKVNRFECGYDATFIGFGSSIQPEIPNFGGSALFIRNSFFGAYSRIIPIGKVKTGMIIGLSGGFDSRPPTFGNTYMITAWALYGVLF